MVQKPTCIECGGQLVWDNHAGHVPRRCKECKRKRDTARMAAWREANPDRQKAISRRNYAKRRQDPEFMQRKRDWETKRLYGMEPGDLQRLIDSQDGRCAICRGEPNGPGTRLHVDHCHSTNRVRGMLCGRCNTLLGLAHEDPAILRAAISYLE